MVCRIPILRFEQHCSTEPKIGFVPTFAQFFSFLILKSSSRTCCRIQKYRTFCVPFDVLLPIDPSENSPFLQHSLLSRSKFTLQISKCGSQSVPSDPIRIGIRIGVTIFLKDIILLFCLSSTRFACMFFILLSTTIAAYVTMAKPVCNHVKPFHLPFICSCLLFFPHALQTYAAPSRDFAACSHLAALLT